jgi:hypothetical protein
MASNVCKKGWRWVLSALTQTVKVGNKSTRCRVPIVDTIFWDARAGAALEWIWANKHGEVVRKKTAHLSATAIMQRFQGVLEDNGNAQAVIAHGFAGNAQTSLRFPQLEQFVTGGADGSRKAGGVPAFDSIQLAIEAKTPQLPLLRNMYSQVNGGKVSTRTLAVNADGEGAAFESPHICHQIDLFTQRVVKHLEAATDHTVLRLEADYVIDASDRIWLQGFHKVLVDDTSDDEAAAEEVEGDDDAAAAAAAAAVAAAGVDGDSEGVSLPPIGGVARPQSVPHESDGGGNDAGGGSCSGSGSGSTTSGTNKVQRNLSAPTNFRTVPSNENGGRVKVPGPGGARVAPGPPTGSSSVSAKKDKGGAGSGKCADAWGSSWSGRRIARSIASGS